MGDRSQASNIDAQRLFSQKKAPILVLILVLKGMVSAIQLLGSVPINFRIVHLRCLQELASLAKKYRNVSRNFALVSQCLPCNEYDKCGQSFRVLFKPLFEYGQPHDKCRAELRNFSCHF
jgi:hypothetical protein